MTYRWLPHTADVRAYLEAATLRGVLEDATAVVRELLVGASAVTPAETRTIRVTGTDQAELLLAFLRALLEQYYLDRFVPAVAEVSEPTGGTDGPDVSATIRGESFDPSRHEQQPEVKAVTRHGLKVERTGTGWTAEVVFDV
ncbi:MAG TPA: archease, partial [Gemmatimonadales bacterium]